MVPRIVAQDIETNGTVRRQGLPDITIFSLQSPTQPCLFLVHKIDDIELQGFICLS